jgi:RNA polymerase sigma-70 factor (ECF subfamily)
MTYAPYRNESTRSSILAGIQDPADAAAWARFFDTYAGYVFGIARHRGLPEADADEIVQQVMSGLVHGGALARYDRTRGAFHLWLARRVAWRVANYRRDAEARRDAESRYAAEPPPDALPPGTDDACEEEWRAAVLAEALRRLRAESNPVHYAVFHASAIENLPTDAILRLHPVTPSNLYQIRRRLSARLRTLLAASRRDLESGADLPTP